MSDKNTIVDDNRFHVGDTLQFKGKVYVITGRIEYKDNQKYRWDEYKVSVRGDRFHIGWLSIDEDDCVYWEPCPKKTDLYDWELLENGKEIVENAFNDVDVYPSDSAQFWEYSNKKTGEYYSVEKWDDETEYCSGEKIAKNSIKLLKKGSSESKRSGISDWQATLVYVLAALGLWGVSFGIDYFKNKVDSIEKILKKSNAYEPVTYITGKGKKYATVYKYTNAYNADHVARFIIDQRQGETTSIQQEEGSPANIGILTQDEYCFIYNPVDKNQQKTDTLYLHVATREWTLENLDEPLYCADSSSQRFYTAFYENQGFEADSTISKSTVHHRRRHHYSFFTSRSNDYDSYSSSVREVSRSRRSSGGGHSGGGK
ncbi:MAG: DUF4178 domain-containing protein [Paludibacteraceae bacterium]|nr:DUF4178 domain-containing protein [Paludibacteraceae bacterium]